MKKLCPQTLQQITGGRWLRPHPEPHRPLLGGAFDSRATQGKEIFFAWPGEQADGHDFLGRLQGTSIQVAVVQQEKLPPEPMACLWVPDSLKALHALATYQAKAFGGKILALTGSSGKTTAKTWLSHLLAAKFNLLKNPGSFNNHIGCPITLLDLEESHQLAILEMGTSGQGELDLLSRLAPADVSLLLNVGLAHLGMFGSTQAIWEAKMEIFSHAKPQALKLVPQADQRFAGLGADFVRFGQGSRQSSWKLVETDPMQFRQEYLFSGPYGQERAWVNQIGPHVGETLSALLLICHHLGMTWEEVKPGLASLPQEKGRAVFTRTAQGALLLDDTYNANPSSVINMLQTLALIQAPQRLAVVGNLAELEEDLAQSSLYLLEQFPSGITHLALAGETGARLYPLFQERFPHLELHLAADANGVLPWLERWLTPQSLVGVKGSRSSHMERVVAHLQGDRRHCPLARCGRLCMCKDCPDFVIPA